MRTRNLVGLLLILLILEGAAEAWQNQPTVQGQAPTLNRQSAVPSSPAQVAQPQPYTRPDQPLPRQQIHSEPGSLQAGDPDMPYYPYPKYHNPYYDGAPPGSVLSEVFQWLMDLQSGVMERFSELVDSRLFPAKPATDGGRSR